MTPQTPLTGAIFLTAYLGGILMIFAPCTFALLPAYLGTVFSFSGDFFKRTLAFFFGFSLIFVPLWFTVTLLGKILATYQAPLILIAGLFLIFLGILTILGKNLPRPIKKLPLFKDPLAQAFLFGLFFALGFSGCTGPILVAILATSAILSQSLSFLLMLTFTAGLFTPLFLLSFVGERVKIQKIKFWAQKSQFLGGLLLVILGAIFIFLKGTAVITQKYPQPVVQFGNDLQRKILALKIPLFWEIVIFIFLAFFLVKFFEKKWSKGLNFKINLGALNQSLFFFLAFLLILNFSQIIILNLNFQKKQEEAKEAARPANLRVTQILSPQCPHCLSSQTFLEALKRQNVQIEKEEKLEDFGPHAQNLISQYQIEKLPALIIWGEIEKGDLPKFFSGLGKIQNEAFISQSLPPPYFDLKQGKILGEVKLLTLLADSTCSECYPVSRQEQILSSFGIKPEKRQTFDLASASGRLLLSRYRITLVPTFILEGDLSSYARFNQIWPRVGTKEASTSSGWEIYVFRQGVKTMGIYKDLTTGQVVKPTPPPPTPTLKPTATPTTMPGSSLQFRVK